jgi:hypothetical protein
MGQGGFFAGGRCYACGSFFMFAPDLVPSVPIDPLTNRPPDVSEEGVAGEIDEESARRATLRPICGDCVELANAQRVRMGREDLIVILPGAYDIQEA